jgi:hypothetical protein
MCEIIICFFTSYLLRGKIELYYMQLYLRFKRGEETVHSKEVCKLSSVGSPCLQRYTLTLLEAW